MKIRPVIAEFFHADRRKDGQTERWADMIKARVGPSSQFF